MYVPTRRYTGTTLQHGITEYCNIVRPRMATLKSSDQYWSQNNNR